MNYWLSQLGSANPLSTETPLIKEKLLLSEHASTSIHLGEVPIPLTVKMGGGGQIWIYIRYIYKMLKWHDLLALCLHVHIIAFQY